MRNKRIALALFVAVGAAGCGAEQQTRSPADDVTIRSALETTFTLPVFEGENPQDVALAAVKNLNVNDRAGVVEGVSNGPYALVSNLGVGVPSNTIGTVLGVTAKTGTILSGPIVFLRTSAAVGGSVYQKDNSPVSKQTGTSIALTEKTNVFQMAPDTTWNRTITWPTTFNTTASLEPGQLPAVVPIPPGAYHALDVKTGHTLVLSSGDYFIDALTIEPGAALQVNGGSGPVTAYIGDGGFIFRGSQTAGTATVGMPLGLASFTILTTGSADIESSFSGVVIAPNGTIDLKGASPSFTLYYGAFFGKTVTLYESQVVRHYRDPFSFRGFKPNDGTIFTGDRVTVTGGNNRLPDRDVTDEAHQSESVTAISRLSSFSFVVTVGYNDQTVALTNPSIEYTDFTIGGDPRNGTKRLVHRGESLMGYSYSLDEGRTFNYAGRVAPPNGTAIIWSDPAMAKADIDDANVYYAQISGSNASFNAAMNADGVLEDNAVGGALDGYCIARSTDRGQTFSNVACIADEFQDGTALAVATDANNHRQVYVTGTHSKVYWLDGESMAFHNANTLPIALTPGTHVTHPRLRVQGGFLYIVCQGNGGAIVANRMNLTTNTWQGQTTIASDALTGDLPFGSIGQSVDSGPVFSFDFGPGATATTKLRVLYTSAKTSNAGHTGMKVRECNINLDPTTCVNLGASTLGDGGQEADPSLRFSGGVWMAAWRKVDDPPSITMRHVAARITGGGTGFDQRTVRPGVIPCAYDVTHQGRWGEYDLIDGFGNGRFFVPYGVNGPGCRWQGQFSSDAHIGGSAVLF